MGFFSDLARNTSWTYKIFAQNWSNKSRALLKSQNYEIGQYWFWFHVWDQNFEIFWEKRIDFGTKFCMSKSFFWPNHYKNPSVGSDLKFFIFRSYGFFKSLKHLYLFLPFYITFPHSRIAWYLISSLSLINVNYCGLLYVPV